MSDQAPVLRLVPPAISSPEAPELSSDQAAVVDLPQGSGPQLIWGAPGTGKTMVLVEAAVRRVQRDGVDPARVLLLTPSRLAASRIRDALSARLQMTMSTSPARTWASYAFDLLRRVRLEGAAMAFTATAAPRLISGPEQDLFIRELLEGHRLGLVPGPRWPTDLAEALNTRGFRQEVRQLFDRVIDSGLSPEQLTELGERAARPDWQAAAQLFGEYRDLIELQDQGSFDPAGIIRAAGESLAVSPQWLDRERERYQLILIDDLQEVGRAAHDLLAQLGGGKDVLMTACPDVVVQGFRGARPDLVGTVRESLAAQELVLSTSHRLGGTLTNAWQRVAERIAQREGGHKARSLVPAVSPISPVSGTEADEVSVSSALLGSEVQQRRYIAERILHLFIDEERPLTDIAVIVRTGAQVAAVQRYLSAHGIPVRVPAAETPVREEPAVRPLLEAYELALEPEKLDAERAVQLLSSRIGGLSAVQIRRLRQALRGEEIASGGGRGSDELLIEAMNRPAQLTALGIDGRAAARTARVLQAGREALAEPGANPQTVLWALWSATGLSEEWAAAALREDTAGPRADRDLDAMMALFQAAERYVERAPAAGPQVFLEYLLNQELPMDTLAARAQTGDAVEVLTPASAAGREWPVVIVAGLQEGVWPNNRLRGELLGSQYLVEVLELGVEQAQQLTATHRMRDIRYDELRSFSAAISRASQRLICLGVSSEDEQPSSFLELIDPWQPSDGQQSRPLTEVRRPKNLRSLVAEIRQFNESNRDQEEAAQVLAALARQGVQGAAPESWWGLAPLSSTAPILPADAVVPVSPSKIEAVMNSPLNWFIQAAGGEAEQDFARNLGTLIHAIAQDLPAANQQEYLAELQRRWPSLGLRNNWQEKLDRKKAEKMLGKLTGYLSVMSSEGRRLLAVEEGFGVEIPGPRTAALKGIVDRLEIDARGRLVIIDLKTGSRKPRAQDLAEHPQLGAYQVAAAAGAFSSQAEDAEPGGAALVQLGGSTVSVSVQEQEALNSEQDWATPLVQGAAELMSAAEFAAVHDPQRDGGRSCPFPEVCPLCRGKQVTE
ncbi:superfamily I DNA/RNA helicase/RecB family exonuclease [Psychromicrobium silvestre]|uniref:DNA 3'-5' helicase n=1 Tax=Psychromicrobium silvestre TaxID=1645614 RepID=A0A7Y9LSX5_9MICC|nr:ATP-dependent DNA helicase [Psychromicrobium silvestre]NYE95020.1 superfamily I DNA/RNA helicase/RecB family exonuclease [Psychromicrobium silvestre]